MKNFSTIFFALLLLASATQINAMHAKNTVPYLADPTDYSQELPLIELVIANRVDLITEFIRNGNDVNTAGRGGRTALIWAAAYKRDTIVKLLLAAGADPLKIDNLRLSALDYATNQQAEKCINLIINHYLV